MPKRHKLTAKHSPIIECTLSFLFLISVNKTNSIEATSFYCAMYLIKTVDPAYLFGNSFEEEEKRQSSVGELNDLGLVFSSIKLLI